MATITKTWAFPADAQSWVFTSGGTATGAWDGTDGSPAAGDLQSDLIGKSITNADFWELTGTWEALFGVPTGSTVTNVGGTAGDGHVWKCSVFTTGGTGNQDGPFELRDSTGALTGTFSTAVGFSATTAWSSNVAASSITINEASSTTRKLRLNNTLATGASKTAEVTLKDDTIVLTVTYTAGAPSSAAVNVRRMRTGIGT